MMAEREMMKRNFPGSRGELPLLFLVIGLIYEVRVWHKTWFDLGFYFFIPVLVLMAVAAYVAHLYYRGATGKAWSAGWWTGIILFVVALAAFEIDRYRPTMRIEIPAEYAGCVYLFGTDVTTDRVVVDAHGIGYLPRSGEFNLKVMHGDRNISEVLEAADSNTLQLSTNDPDVQRVVSVLCFNVEPGKEYQFVHWLRAYPPCMDLQEYEELMAMGWVDSARVHVQRYDLRVR